MNMSRNVVISAGDQARIHSCLEKASPVVTKLLLDELDAATIVPNDQLPGNVVNMGSVVTFRDLDSGESSQCTLVFPHEADSTRYRISILAPVGAALIGLAESDTIAWPVPGGKFRKLEVVTVRQSSHIGSS